MKIACIGHRDISEVWQRFAANIGYTLVKRGHTIVSGNARGADSSFARGGNKFDPTKVILYCPGKKNNPEYIADGNVIHTEILPAWATEACKHRKNYFTYSEYVQNLFNRNVGIVWNSDAVIAMPNHAKMDGGGTGHSIKVARAQRLPVLDISQFDPENKKNIFIVSDWVSNLFNNKVPIASKHIR